MNPFKTLAMTAAIAGIFGLAGCATPRSPADDANIHTVSIVTVIDESGPIDRVGLTIFNNDARKLPQDGALSRAVVDDITQRLHRARPQWTVVPAGVDLVALASKYPRIGTFTDPLGNVRPDLDEIERRTGADAVILVSDASLENEPGRGVGIIVHKLPGFDPVVIVRAHVAVDLLDKTGTRLAGALGSQAAPVKAAQLGMTDDLQSASDPAIQTRLSDAMQAELRRQLDKAMEQMGY